MLLAATLFLLLSLVANIGLMLAIMEMTKSIVIRGDVRLTLAGSGTSGTLVRVGDSERHLNGSTMITPAGRLVGTTKPKHKPAVLHSNLPDEALDELRILNIDGENYTHLSLTISGWTRDPLKSTGSEPVIHLITLPGYIRIEGTTLSFEDSSRVGEVFVEAGFAVDARGFSSGLSSGPSK